MKEEVRKIKKVLEDLEKPEWKIKFLLDCLINKMELLEAYKNLSSNLEAQNKIMRDKLEKFDNDQFIKSQIKF